MTPSSANVREKKKVARPEPQTISMPAEQVTGDPVPGYTTEAFWRDFEAQHGGSEEFERFEHLTARILQVPKQELDEKRTERD